MTKTRTIIAAPGVGMVVGTFGATAITLEDRAANDEAFAGERLVRVPRRAVNTYHKLWLLEHSKLAETTRNRT